MTTYTSQEFLTYLRDQLIPDFKEADMPATADDFETAAQLITSLADERAELIAALRDAESLIETCNMRYPKETAPWTKDLDKITKLLARLSP